MQLHRNSESLILGPRNLDKIFENKQIVQDSENLFLRQNFWSDKKSEQVKQDTNQNKTETEPTPESLVNDILLRLNNETDKNNEVKIINLLQELYECLDKNKLFASKVCSKLKIQILKCLYKQVESQNEEVLLQVARIILEVCISFFITLLIY